jgi:hypothetical protein
MCAGDPVMTGREFASDYDTVGSFLLGLLLVLQSMDNPNDRV